MNAASSIQPRLLGQMTERAVLRELQDSGPASRADLARRMGNSPPTVSKAVASLLDAGLLEEVNHEESGRGRPAKRVRLASEKAQVLGLVIGARQCRLIAAGLDGKLREDTELSFPTPDSYGALVAAIVEHAQALIDETDATILGLGLSMPGLIDYRDKRCVLSPNLPVTDDHRPEADLAEGLGIACVMLQETHTLCLAEQRYGEARGIADFAMLDIETGVGLGVVSGGRVLTGHSGLAGEIGHIPLVPDGLRCGCGLNGCLETVASDAAIAAAISGSIGETMSMDQILSMVIAGTYTPDGELDAALEHLAVGMAMVINLFNPATLFVYGRLFELREGSFERLLRETEARALGPAFADCAIVRARGSKRQGAVAAIIEYLTDAVAPSIGAHSNFVKPGAKL
ncbi:MAG: putative NBD/HSP70 family sugar kinase [Rhodothermales bacterium]|jgi:predicted NBD/HSP70 family sugar kinase